MLKVAIEYASALSGERRFVELLIEHTDNGRLTSWDDSRENETTRSLSEEEVALIRESVRRLRVEVGAFPDYSGFRDGWSTRLSVEDTYTSISLKWFCSAPEGWQAAEELATAVLAVGHGEFKRPYRVPTINIKDLLERASEEREKGEP
jgi:hypothetical protein